jgi:hypothetical protein
MRFSVNPDKRHDRAIETLQICQESQMERASFYRTVRHIYRYGAHSGIECKDNRIKPIIDRLSSFLYAPESVNFWADLGPQALSNWADIPDATMAQLGQIDTLQGIPEDKLEAMLESVQFDRIESVIDSINDSWTDTDIDVELGDSIDNALIDGCAIMTLQVEERSDGKNSIVSYPIMPEYFGVWREDQKSLSKQQAVAHTTHLSEPEIRFLLWSHPDREEIMKNLEPGENDQVSAGRIFPTSANDTSISGSPLGVFTGQFDYQPKHGAPLYKLHELYVWDDAPGDYRYFKIVGDRIIADFLVGGEYAPNGALVKKGNGIKGRLPFVKICPYPIRNYFFGWSLVDGLQVLQNWYSARLNKLDETFEKSLDKPRAVMGMGGLSDEIDRALNTAGGTAYIGQPGASVQEMDRSVPPEALEILESIRDNFYDFSSMRPSMFGKEDKQGARTEGIASQFMRVGAAPIRRIALTVEKQIEEIASLLFLFKRRYEDEKLSGPNGETFVLAEFPEDARIKVDGHSQCPLFVEDNARQAEALQRAGVLTPTTLVDLVHPQMKGLIKFRLRKIEMAKMVAEQQMKMMQQQKRSGKESQK